MTEGGGFDILVICTANICRSPMAEALLVAKARDRGVDVQVSSAGFMFDGEPAAPKAAAVAGERGLDLSPHRSRIVTPELLDAADLVVTMERRHARDLIVETPEAVDRVDTLGAMADGLADLEDSEGLTPTERVRVVLADRSAAQLLSNGPDEVADPHGRSRRRHRLALDRIAVLVDGLLDGLYSS